MSIFRNEKNFNTALELMSSLIYKGMIREENTIESERNYIYI